ncbi:hypothetical protein MRX96_000478 [Rhipicephalus microplus]
MSRRMLKHRYPTGKATETAQPVAPLPQPAADVMPQWDGTASFQPAQYPAAVLDPQQPQNISQEGWPSLPTAAANSSTAGSAVQYGQGENYWNWNMHQESAAVAGGDGMTSPLNAVVEQWWLERSTAGGDLCTSPVLDRRGWGCSHPIQLEWVAVQTCTRLQWHQLQVMGHTTLRRSIPGLSMFHLKRDSNMLVEVL